jgi:regulator of sigma E protease
MITGVLASIVYVVLGLSVLVILHELGHFIAAKWAGIKTEEFGIGYPPKALKLFRKWQTDFTLNWIPFGGFVRMAGENLDPNAPVLAIKKGDFYSVSGFKRLVVIFAGVTVNLIFGVIVFSLVFFQTGIPQELKSPRVVEVVEDSPASKLNLTLPVEIVGFELDGQLIKTETVEAVQDLVAQHRGEELTIVTTGKCEQMSCQDELIKNLIYLRLPEETPSEQGSLGIVFDQMLWVRYPWYEMIWRSAVHGFNEALGLAGLILNALGSVVTDAFHGKFQDQLAGPVGIVEQVHQAGVYRAGWQSWIYFVGMLSVNLGLINILPFPPLDGGKGVMTIAEWLIGRRRSLKIEHYLSYGGWFVLMALIVGVTLRDIWRIADKFI